MTVELFRKQRSLLEGFFERLEENTMKQVFDIFFHCEGTLIFTGVGKSGFVAEQVAHTMTSLGTRAFYLSPVNAMHGDLGFISSKDLVIVLSKSGGTEELYELLLTLKNRQIATMGWFCQTQSKLSSFCDYVVTLPIEKELCLFDLSPTTSTIVQLIFGNTLAVSLMEAKGFSLDQYALNHPRGIIGKKILLKVKDIMLKGPQLPICRADETLQEVLVELSNKRCGCLLIVGQNRELEGIFTDGDLRRVILKHGQQAFAERIEQFMSKNYLSIHPDATAVEALNIMEKQGHNKRVMMLPVLEDKKLLGLICLHDIIAHGLS